MDYIMFWNIHQLVVDVLLVIIICFLSEKKVKKDKKHTKRTIVIHKSKKK